MFLKLEPWPRPGHPAPTPDASICGHRTPGGGRSGSRRCFLGRDDRSHFPLARSSIFENPGSPAGVFSLPERLSVSDGEAGADGQGGELVDRVAVDAPVRELLFIEERVDGAVSEKRLSSYGDRWFKSPSLQRRVTRTRTVMMP